MKTLSQSLQRAPAVNSPGQDDPAAVLWKAYADKKGGEPVLPPLPVFSLSQKTAAKDFRRTASCGIEWPISSSKRRKLKHHDPHSTTKQIFASKRKEILQSDISRQSRVSLLLDNIQQSFVARQRDQDAPSSSSPLPVMLNVVPDQISPAEELPPVLPPARISQSADSPMRTSRSPLQNDEKTSEYGDMDLNDEDLEEIEQALTQDDAHILNDAHRPPPPTLRHANTAHPACIGDSATEDMKQSPNSRIRPQSPTSRDRPVSKKNFNVFVDDFSDGCLDDDLEELMANVGSQRAAQAAAKDTRENRPVQELRQDHDPAISANLDGAYDNHELLDALDEKVNANTPTDSRAISRYLVVEVSEQTYQHAPGRNRPQKLLSVRDERTKRLHAIVLRQSWYESRCIAGIYVHLIGEFDQHGQCIVDDNTNMIILHPDHLVSATVVGDAITCLRRAVLQDRVKATSPPERSQVYGHILHEVFGEVMRLNDWDTATFQRVIAQLLPTYLESLYEVGVQTVDATEHLMSKVPLMQGWASLFISAVPRPGAEVRDRKDNLVPTAVNKLLELEEHVWSPMYGLKGNIDATVQVSMRSPDTSTASTLVLPLELKTGARENVEAHRAQTALYTLLLTDRYDVEVTCGILYYMETSKTYRIEGVRHELRQMIIWRNMIAGYVHDKLALPPVLKREHLCKRCYAQTSCFTYHKLLENGDGETSGVKEVFDEAVGHLQSQHQTFFRKWDELLTKEERDCMKFRRELWTMLSTEREQVGRCFANMVIEVGSAQENLAGPKINRFVYSFVKQDVQPGQSLLESQITVGEPIVVSDERGHFALANGFVTHVRPNRITVAVDRRLQNARKKTRDFDAVVNQSFVGIMNVTDVDNAPSSFVEEQPPALYRIDKDEFSNGMATVRNNLIRMMEKGLFRAKELRELIIDLKPPVFKHTSTAYQLTGPASQQNINIDQRRAIEKVMTAKDFALVLGMPGTGKTTTIAHIIRALVSQNKSILLASYTHTAVDNILLKIKDDNIPILRLGATAKIHQDVQSFADLSSKPKASLEELERSWQRSQVVATTCLGINHGIFNHRIFDYCIVDEASQITLPVCLGPIRFAHTFILVGDHYQLPPLVQNKEAQEGGLDVSLFKLLSDAQPQSVVTLEHQYRMAEDIMSLSNALIYGGRLKCGTEAVATRTLQVPNIDVALEAHHNRTRASQPTPAGSFSCSAQNSNCWLRAALRPFRRVTFLNTDKITSPQSAAESVHGGSNRITNPIESLLTAQLLTTLIRAGVPAKSIGVITFYRSQLALLKRDVKSTAGTNAAGDVEIHTADKYQGRDKEVILLSCVRSNEQNSVGELLKDWRRVNVAITRARSKLIVVGSHHTLANSGVSVLQGLCRKVKDSSWLIDLPPDPINGHVFARAFTQTQAQTQEVLPLKVNPSAQRSDQPSERPALAQLDHNVGTPAAAAAAATQRPTRHPLSASKPLVSTLERDSMGYSYTSHVKKPFKAPKRVVGGSNVNLERVIARNPVMADILQDVGRADYNTDNNKHIDGNDTRTTSKNRDLENDLAAFAEFFEEDDVDF